MLARLAKPAPGFTLLELLVVIIIISILAVIAIPVFFRQRDKGFVAQSESALANAQLMAEAYFVGAGEGSYIDLHGPNGPTLLEQEGLKKADTVQLVVGAKADEYCIVAVHTGLPSGHDWKRGTVHSTLGAPSPTDNCPGYVL